YCIRTVTGNLAPGQIASRLGARGVNMTTTTACASGAHAIGEAFEMIRSGRQDVVVPGGAEAAITPTAVAGFGVMRALARWDGPPEGASRPFDARRSGFVLGEGAGVLVLEAEEVARRRGAPVRAEVLGYGASADAHHITQPPPDGSGAQRAIRAALTAAGVGPDAVQHVNAHGTSTRQGDIAETRALHAVFGAHARSLAVSATKSMTGHLLGAAGAGEGGETVLGRREGAGTSRAGRHTLRVELAEPAGPGSRLAVGDQAGKSHVEVTAVFADARRTRVLSCAFPRHDPGALAGGFAEHGAPEAAVPSRL